MRTEVILAALLGGGATYLIRFLPLLAGERLRDRPPPPWLHRFLLALGPAAIAALLALSVADLIAAQARGAALFASALGGGAVVLVHRLGGNVAWATLAGAACYGLGQVLAAG